MRSAVFTFLRRCRSRLIRFSSKAKREVGPNWYLFRTGFSFGKASNIYKGSGKFLKKTKMKGKDVKSCRNGLRHIASFVCLKQFDLLQVPAAEAIKYSVAHIKVHINTPICPGRSGYAYVWGGGDTCRTYAPKTVGASKGSSTWSRGKTLNILGSTFQTGSDSFQPIDSGCTWQRGKK